MRQIVCGWSVCAAAALLAVGTTPSRATQEPDWAQLEQCAREELAEAKIPGAAVAVVRGDRVVFSRGFGVANVETGQPVTPETLFRLASVTKIFTAASALRMVEEGKLRLDAPVGDTVKGLAPAVGRPTLHQLLSHTSGFRDDSSMDGPHDDAALGAEARSWKDELAFMPPGRIFSYSNFGYVLSGVATETAAGKPFADAVRELVLKPLGMQRSTFRPTETVTYPFSQGHHPNREGQPEVVRPYLDHAGTWPAGCLNSSVDELSRFTIAFMNGGQLEGKPVLSPSLIARMSKPNAEIPSSGSGERYGYGLVCSSYRGTPMLAHGGARVGFGAELRMFPEHRVAVIALGNRSGGILRRTVERATELALALPEPKPAPAAAPEAEPPLAAYTGTFDHGPIRSVIELKEGKLFVREDGEELELKRYDRHRFKARDHAMFMYTFVMGADGKAHYIHRGYRAMMRVDPPLAAAAP